MKLTKKILKQSLEKEKLNEYFQANTFVMSFQHGIVNIATSLPIPLLVADRMAKRGRNNLKAQ